MFLTKEITGKRTRSGEYHMLDMFSDSEQQCSVQHIHLHFPPDVPLTDENKPKGGLRSGLWPRVAHDRLDKLSENI